MLLKGNWFVKNLNTPEAERCREYLKSRQLSNSTIEKVESISNTEINITLTGSTFLTGSNTSLDLGFSVANTITLDENTIVRTGSKVVVTANDHGVSSGDYVVLKGATDDFSEFNASIWEDNSSGSFGGNFCSFTPLNTNIYNGHLILRLTDISENIDCNEITGDIKFFDKVNLFF